MAFQPGLTAGPAVPRPRTGICGMASPWVKAARRTSVNFRNQPLATLQPYNPTILCRLIKLFDQARLGWMRKYLLI